MPKGPWPVGTLLAYHVISNDSDYVRNSSLWNKYVLLRVVKVGSFFDDNSKSMAVCLYDWTGESLPDHDIVKSLSFTHISIDKPLLRGSALSYSIGMLNDDNISKTKLDEIIDNVSKARECTFVLLDWRCCKGIENNTVFTTLECDPAFLEHAPAIYNDHTSGIVLTHSIPFDATLVRRFCLDEESANHYSDSYNP